MRTNNPQADYLKARSETMRQSRIGGDDRQMKAKQQADAELRGRIGADAGNRLIREIDAIVSRNRF